MKIPNLQCDWCTGEVFNEFDGNFYCGNCQQQKEAPELRQRAWKIKHLCDADAMYTSAINPLMRSMTTLESIL